jgi:hypothetical protein
VTRQSTRARGVESDDAPPLAPFLIALGAVGLGIYALFGALAVWEAAGRGFLPVALLVTFGLGLLVAALGVARLLRRASRRQAAVQ